jgi:chromosome transmission fidelity protein 1
MDKFVDRIHKTPMDIEELAKQGTRRAVCPYYAARLAVAEADIILVPYSCLVHR